MRFPPPSGKSGIAWTDDTVALGLYGCTRVSPACTSCWAEQMAGRLAAMGNGDYARVSRDGRWSGTVTRWGIEHVLPLVAYYPRARSGHRYVFPWSMTDFLHESVPVEWAAEVIYAMGDRPDVTWQVLTKRADRYPDLAAALRGDWPQNVWAGATVEDRQRYAERVPGLLAVPAAVRWLSVEPMLDWIPLERGIQWIVCGGESGATARPLHWPHVYELRDRCAELGSAFFLKQGAGFKPRKDLGDCPADLRVREMPRVAA